LGEIRQIEWYGSLCPGTNDDKLFRSKGLGHLKFERVGFAWPEAIELKLRWIWKKRANLIRTINEQNGHVNVEAACIGQADNGLLTLAQHTTFGTVGHRLSMPIQ
jgi:hypothetical protein